MKFLIVFSAVLAYAAAVNVGGYCTSNDDCTVADSYCAMTDPCTTGVCSCKEKYTAASATSCVAIVYKKVGESCSGTYDVCEGDWVGCSGNTCTCTNGFTGNSGDTGCSWQSNLKDNGQSCTYSPECKAYKHWYEQDNKGNAPWNNYVSAGCISSVCACATNFQSNTDLDQCTSSLTAFGGDCSSTTCDSMTVPGSTCRSNTCQCASGYSVFTNSYSVYDFYEQTCALDGSTVVEKGQTCTSSGNNPKHCGKGQVCATCPNSSAYICMDGAEHISISLILLVAAMLFHKLF